MTLQLKTERLILRTPRSNDASAIAEGIGNYNVARHLNPITLPYTEAMATDWLATIPENTPESATFIIELPGKDLIGAISLGKEELGYWLKEIHWGQGYATEAAIALLQWHFTNTRADNVPSAAHLDNPASLAVQRKLGFIECGTKHQFSAAQNCKVEHVVTMLTRDAFRQRGYLS